MMPRRSSSITALGITKIYSQHGNNLCTITTITYLLCCLQWIYGDANKEFQEREDSSGVWTLSQAGPMTMVPKLESGKRKEKTN